MNGVILMALRTTTHPQIQPLTAAKICFLENALYISAKNPPTMKKDIIYSTRIIFNAKGIAFSRCTCQGSIICIHSVSLAFMIQQAFFLPTDNLGMMIEDVFREKHSTSSDPANLTRVLELLRNLHPKKMDSQIMQH